MARALLTQVTPPVSRSGTGTSRRSVPSVLAASLHPEPWNKTPPVVGRYGRGAQIFTNGKISSARHRRPADGGYPVVVWGDQALRKECLRPIERLLLRSTPMARALRRTFGHLRVRSRVRTERGQVFRKH